MRLVKIIRELMLEAYIVFLIFSICLFVVEFQLTLKWGIMEEYSHGSFFCGKNPQNFVISPLTTELSTC